MGLLTFDTLPQGLLPPGFYLLLHLLEANFITPILLGRRFTLNPVVIFVSLIFWTWLWGVPGGITVDADPRLDQGHQRPRSLQAVTAQRTAHEAEPAAAEAL